MRSTNQWAIVSHPFLFGIYAVLALLAHNITQVSPEAALPALLAVLAGTGATLGLFFLLLRDAQRASLITTVLVLLFFSYGHVYARIKSYSLGAMIVGRHRYLLGLWLVIALVAIKWVISKGKRQVLFHFYLNVVGIILVCLSLSQIIYYQLGMHLAQRRHISSSELETGEISLSQSQPAPDIYYIVLDGYARADILQEVYGIDNQDFVAALQRLGFQVASCAHSNYNETYLSLTSTFNMNYVQSLPPYAPDKGGRAWIPEYLKHNKVRTLLEGLGYRTIVFYHVYETLLWDDAEVYKAPSIGLMLNPFETLLLQTTPALAWLDSATAQLTDRDRLSRLNTLYALSQLPQLPASPGPKFVFAHLMVPHSPFVFGADGEEIRIPYDPLTDTYLEDDFWRGYRGHVLFINQRILPVLEEIIAHSRTPPIIILASDHGTDHTSNLQNDFLNLGAYYLPGSPAPQVYSSLSPVNAFRLIFNAYFNGQYEILPDKSFLCDEGATYFICEEITLPPCP